MYRSILKTVNESSASILDQSDVCFDVRWVDLRYPTQLWQAFDELAETDEIPWRKYLSIVFVTYVEAIEKAELHRED